jgi:hypothetical protein
MIPGISLDEISLIHGVPPWSIDAGRPVPNLRKRLLWRLRASAYRIGLRRLAVFRFESDQRPEPGLH